MELTQEKVNEILEGKPGVVMIAVHEESEDGTDAGNIAFSLHEVNAGFVANTLISVCSSFIKAGHFPKHLFLTSLIGAMVSIDEEDKE